MKHYSHEQATALWYGREINLVKIGQLISMIRRQNNKKQLEILLMCL